MPANPSATKIAFIGSHGVGKTTLAYGLAARLKRLDVALEVVHEVARRSPLPSNEETTLAAQAWILHTQIADEIVAAARSPVVICDRSVLDNFVYLLLATGSPGFLDSVVHGWLDTYDLLIHVPMVQVPRADGVRSSSPAFQSAVDERLREELERRGLNPLELDTERRSDWLDVAERAALLLLAPRQLRLL